MRVGFTGTQVGMSDRQKYELEKFFHDNELGKDDEFHHGDCIGADMQADTIARAFGLQIHIHPPSNYSKRAFCAEKGDTVYMEQEYLERNKAIVDSSQWLVAAPKGEEEELRSGTWSTVRYARKKGMLIRMLSR